jgi:hypothetical protein
MSILKTWVNQLGLDDINPNTDQLRLFMMKCHFDQHLGFGLYAQAQRIRN